MKAADMTALPAPLTPADCNLQDFAFMPLDVARLRDSDMAAYESPEACWAAVLLWSAAWHQVPAASLPDDDRFLAKAAGYGRVVKEWMNVRAGALHGWVKCADGRLYHPVVAEKANESWRAKLHHAWKKECDRIRKANKQRETEGKQSLPFPPEPSSDSASLPPEVVELPPENPSGSDGSEKTGDGNPSENALKGQGEGQGQGELNTKPPGFDPRASAQPELGAGESAPPTAAAALSIAMRAFGINGNPADLRLIALADQGVTADTVRAACETAREAKRGAAIPPAFVFSILERWAKEAADLKAKGAAQPRASPRTAARDNMQRLHERINGARDHEPDPRIIDINEPPA
jgi:hypothetical protein